METTMENNIEVGFSKGAYSKQNPTPQTLTLNPNKLLGFEEFASLHRVPVGGYGT